MKILLTVVFLMVAFPNVKFGNEPIPDFAKRECPQCFKEYVKYSYTVSLPVGMRKALREYNPTFKIFKMEDFAEELRLRLEPGLSNLSCYSAIFNDFNGDGQFDAAVFGEVDSTKNKENFFPILAILSQGATNYKVVEVTRVMAYKPVTASIKLVKPGKISEVGSDGGEEVEMKNYGILETMGYGSKVYYWDETQKKFKEITTGGM